MTPDLRTILIAVGLQHGFDSPMHGGKLMPVSDYNLQRAQEIAAATDEEPSIKDGYVFIPAPVSASRAATPQWTTHISDNPYSAGLR